MVFDPWDLQMVITPESIKEAIKDEDHVNGNYSNEFWMYEISLILILALIMSLKLNEVGLVQEAIESIPAKDGK